MRGSVFALCLAVSGPVTAVEVIRDAGSRPISRAWPRPCRRHGNPWVHRSCGLIGRSALRTTCPSGLRASVPDPSRRAAPRRGSCTLFLLGADPGSLRWLDENRERLKHLRAIGMLVPGRGRS